ncbi:hypothetical protein C8Q77DRAFT_283530 [Trametes polyzona]|nr:hypothetical protein C8Q77DRAFT_283530 [Trametes polyzona]
MDPGARVRCCWAQEPERCLQTVREGSSLSGCACWADTEGRRRRHSDESRIHSAEPTVRPPGHARHLPGSLRLRPTVLVQCYTSAASQDSPRPRTGDLTMAQVRRQLQCITLHRKQLLATSRTTCRATQPRQTRYPSRSLPPRIRRRYKYTVLGHLLGECSLSPHLHVETPRTRQNTELFCLRSLVLRSPGRPPVVLHNTPLIAQPGQSTVSRALRWPSHTASGNATPDAPVGSPRNRRPSTCQYVHPHDVSSHAKAPPRGDQRV